MPFSSSIWSGTLATVRFKHLHYPRLLLILALALVHLAEGVHRDPILLVPPVVFRIIFVLLLLLLLIANTLLLLVDNSCLFGGPRP